MVSMTCDSLRAITLVERADCRYWLVNQLTGQKPATPPTAPIIKEIWVKRPRQAGTVPPVAYDSCRLEGKSAPLFWLGMIDQPGTLPRIMGGPIGPNHPEWRFHAATMA